MRKHIHIGCYGIIEQDNKIVLIKKARGPYTGKLDLPGGGFEYGETPQECVTREVLEETGLEIESLELADAFAFNCVWNDTNEGDVEELHHVAIFFKVKVKSYDLKTEPDGLDSLGASFYSMDDLDKNNLSPLVCYIINNKLFI